MTEGKYPEYPASLAGETSNLKYVQKPHPTPAPAAPISGDKQTILLDTYMAYRSLMHTLTVGQLASNLGPESKADLQAAACIFTEVMEEVDRQTRGGMALTTPAEHNTTYSQIPAMRIMAQMQELAIKQEAATKGNIPATAETAGKIRQFYQCIQLNPHLSGESLELISTMSLVATQHVTICYLMNKD